MARNFLEYESAIPVYRQYGHFFHHHSTFVGQQYNPTIFENKKNQKAFGFEKNQYANSKS